MATDMDQYQICHKPEITTKDGKIIPKNNKILN
jgi:hypothetical protein